MTKQIIKASVFAITPILLLASCDALDELLSVEAPSQVVASDLEDPKSAQLLAASVANEFRCTHTYHAAASAITGNEWRDASNNTVMNIWDARVHDTSGYGSQYASADCGSGQPALYRAALQDALDGRLCARAAWRVDGRRGPRQVRTDRRSGDVRRLHLHAVRRGDVRDGVRQRARRHPPPAPSARRSSASTSRRRRPEPRATCSTPCGSARPGRSSIWGRRRRRRPPRARYRRASSGSCNTPPPKTSPRTSSGSSTSTPIPPR